MYGQQQVGFRSGIERDVPTRVGRSCCTAVTMCVLEQNCLGSNPSSAISYLCNPGHVCTPLCALVSPLYRCDNSGTHLTAGPKDSVGSPHVGPRYSKHSTTGYYNHHWVRVKSLPGSVSDCHAQHLQRLEAQKSLALCS